MASDAAADAPPLDPGRLQVIRSSAARLASLQDEFIRQLHSDIVTLIPDLGSDGWAFCERMVKAALWAATADQPAQVIADGLRWVGAANQLEGFPEEQYVSVAHALVRAVHALSEYDWSASLGSAWISYFLWMKPHLVLGAQQAARHQEAERAAARQEADRLRAQARGALSQPGGGDVDLESAGKLLDDEDDEGEAGYGQIMVSMTRNQRRERPQHPG
jgi:hypothetical protein